MSAQKKLVVPLGNTQEEVIFDQPHSDTEREDIFQLRYKIYSRYNYLNPDRFESQKEFDDYDTNKQSTYFTARVGNRLLGFVRLIQAPVLPIEKSFTFKPPEIIAQAPHGSVGELGRLVIDKYSDDVFFPRNMILLFLTNCIAEYCHEHNVQYAYSFIKKRLTEKLNRLGLPYTRIEPYNLIYPSDGAMAPYFFNEENPVYPAFFTLNEVEDFVNKTIKNKLLFKQTAPNEYRLQNNLYTRFLKTVHIM